MVPSFRSPHRLRTILLAISAAGLVVWGCSSNPMGNDSPIDVSRQAVAKHLDVLEGAGLVRVRREGRYRLHTLDRAPLRAAWDEWFRPLVQPDDPNQE